MDIEAMVRGFRKEEWDFDSQKIDPGNTFEGEQTFD